MPRSPHAQQGIVLIIALILLIVISLLAVLSIRNAVSTESVTANVRTVELATQAAEIALRHCESSVAEVMTVASGGTPTYTTTFDASNILPASVPPTPAQWENIATWDSASTATFVLPLSLVNQTGMAITTYKRPPECMVESLPVMLAGSSTISTTSSFVVTARGFGPEVEADPARKRPKGSEVWLQSHIELE